MSINSIINSMFNSVFDGKGKTAESDKHFKVYGSKMKKTLSFRSPNERMTLSGTNPLHSVSSTNLSRESSSRSLRSRSTYESGTI